MLNAAHQYTQPVVTMASALRAGAGRRAAASAAVFRATKAALGAAGFPESLRWRRRAAVRQAMTGSPLPMAAQA